MSEESSEIRELPGKDTGGYLCKVPVVALAERIE